jgi:hypothetical protein
VPAPLAREAGAEALQTTPDPAGWAGQTGQPVDEVTGQVGGAHMAEGAQQATAAADPEDPPEPPLGGAAAFAGPAGLGGPAAFGDPPSDAPGRQGAGGQRSPPPLVADASGHGAGTGGQSGELAREPGPAATGQGTGHTVVG